MRNKGNKGSVATLTDSNGNMQQRNTAQSSSACTSSRGLTAHSSAAASHGASNVDCGGSISSITAMRQGLALRNSNAQNIPPDTSTGNNTNSVLSSSGGKRKYVPSLLERLHSRTDVENLILSPTEGRSSLTTAPPVSLGERLVDVQAREEAERAEAVQKVAREAFESWRDAKIAEKRAKITR